MSRSTEDAAKRPFPWRIAGPGLGLATPGAAWLIEPDALGLVALASVLVLIAAQVWSYRRYRKAVAAGEPSARDRARDTLASGAGLIGLYGLLLGLAWRFLTRWPRDGSPIDVPIVLFWVGVVYQLTLVGSWLARRRLPRRRWLTRPAAVLIGLLAAGAFISEANTPALARVRTRHADLLRALERSPAPCDWYRRYLHAQGSRVDRPRSLHLGDGRWVLTFAGGSADADGSTIVVDSEEAQGRVFHNDATSEQERLRRIQDSLEPCQAGTERRPSPGGSVGRGSPAEAAPDARK